jgi:hypothetical protein
MIDCRKVMESGSTDRQITPHAPVARAKQALLGTSCSCLERFKTPVAKIVVGGESPIEYGQPVVLAVPVFEVRAREREFVRNALGAFTDAISAPLAVLVDWRPHLSDAPGRRQVLPFLRANEKAGPKADPDVSIYHSVISTRRP